MWLPRTITSARERHTLNILRFSFDSPSYSQVFATSTGMLHIDLMLSYLHIDCFICNADFFSFETCSDLMILVVVNKMVSERVSPDVCVGWLQVRIRFYDSFNTKDTQILEYSQMLLGLWIKPILRYFLLGKSSYRSYAIRQTRKHRFKHATCT